MGNGLTQAVGDKITPPTPGSLKGLGRLGQTNARVSPNLIMDDGRMRPPSTELPAHGALPRDP